jgi:hypothetical protein
MENLNVISYISHDNVKIFDGDNFYHLVSDNVNGKLIYHIKYWDCNVMANFSENQTYLKDKTKFVDKTKLKDYIAENNLEVMNYTHIFAT